MLFHSNTDHSMFDYPGAATPPPLPHTPPWVLRGRGWHEQVLRIV